MTSPKTDLKSDPKQWNVGLIGYGEVGRILAEDLRKQEIKVAAYDIKLRSDQSGGALRDHAGQHGVTLTASHADLAAQSDFIVSAVTASHAVPVAKACAAAVKQGAWYLDFNSASPGAKKRAAALIDAAGGRYVEGAVMTSVPPYRIKVPLLLGGGEAAALAPRLVELGFAAKVASDKLGVASAVKMCRSVMIKGLEAMVIESFTTARAYGVEDARAGLAEGDLSRHRLGKAGRLFLPARDRTWPPPQRRSARGRRNRARGRPDTVVVAGHRRAAGMGRRPGRRRPVRRTRHEGVCAQQRLAHGGGSDFGGNRTEEVKHVMSSLRTRGRRDQSQNAFNNERTYAI